MEYYFGRFSLWVYTYTNHTPTHYTVYIRHELSVLLFVPGGSPYPDLPMTQEFYSALKRGYRMSQPEHAPHAMYDTLPSMSCIKYLNPIQHKVFVMNRAQYTLVP